MLQATYVPRASFRLIAGVTIVAMILSAFPASFFVASAEEVPAVEGVIGEPATNEADNHQTEGDQGDNGEGEEGFSLMNFSVLRGGGPKPPPPPPQKVTICHTSGQSGNYQRLEIDQSAVFNQAPNGHGNHNGDIIPPFGDFQGRNWDDYGQAVYNNDCVPPVAVVSINTVDKLQCGLQDVVVGGSVTFERPTTNDSFVVKLDGVMVLDDEAMDDAGPDGIPHSWTYTLAGVGVGDHTVEVIIYDNASDNTVVKASASTQFSIAECPPQRCENLLVNGSFEDPVVENAALWDKFPSVVGWSIKKLSDDTPTTLELMRGWSGNVAAHGNQYAELDGDHSTKINQAVTTELGAEYKLLWSFAPRHGISADQNQLSVKVNGTEVATNGPLAGSAPLAQSDWTAGSYNFTAGGASTQIEFANGGPSDSFGTFLDDVQVCLVKPAPVCQLTVVSDEETIVEENNTLAVATYTHPNWTASIPGATWIWETAQVLMPTIDTTKTFVETFTINSPTNASLAIAADNGYAVYLNDMLVVDNLAIENNFQSGTQDVVPLTLASGDNELKVVVKNFALAGGTYDSNPAGVLYKLTADGKVTCERTTQIEEEPETYIIDGYKWNDVDGDGEKDIDETGIAGWTINLYGDSETPAQTQITDSNGYYQFEVEEGDWEVREATNPDWEQTFVREDEYYLDKGNSCYFSFGEEEEIPIKSISLGDSETVEVISDGRCEFGNHSLLKTVSICKTTETGAPVSGWPVAMVSEGETLNLVTGENGCVSTSINPNHGEWLATEGGRSGWTQVDVTVVGGTEGNGEGGMYCSFFGQEAKRVAYETVVSDAETYSCTFINKENVPTIDDGDNRGGRTTGTKTNKRRPAGQVLGATTQCGLWLEDYMQKATQNDSYQVLKLQVFLTLQGFVTPLTSVFDGQTADNVKKFQAKYYDDVIKPWYEKGIVPHNRPTGFVYKTTRWKINDIMCPGIEPYPSFEGENLSNNVLISRQ